MKECFNLSRDARCRVLSYKICLGYRRQIKMPRIGCAVTSTQDILTSLHPFIPTLLYGCNKKIQTLLKTSVFFNYSPRSRFSISGRSRISVFLCFGSGASSSDFASRLRRRN